MSVHQPGSPLVTPSKGYIPGGSGASAVINTAWIIIAFYFIEIVLLIFNCRLLLVYSDVNNMQTVMSGLKTVDSYRFGIAILLCILVSIWIYRAKVDARTLGTSSMRFSPGWSVVWFIIPIINLAMGYLVLQEMWQVSDPNISELEGESWKQSRTSPLITTLWMLILVRLVFLLVNLLVMSDVHDKSDSIAFSISTIFFDILTIVTALCGIKVVRSIDQRQRARHERIVQFQAQPALSDLITD